MSLDKDGMPDRVYPCEVGMACKGRYENGNEYECEWLKSQVVDFGAGAEFPVYWCDYWMREGELDLMTEEETRSAR